MDHVLIAMGCLEHSSEMLAGAVAEIAEGADAPPGVCLAVSCAGELFVSSSGVAQAFTDAGPLADPPAIGLDTATDIASVTKLVATTAACVSLVAADEITLDARLDSILPWTAGEPAGAATLEQLLRHRAGLWEWWPLYLAAGDREAALRQVAQRPLRYERGAEHHYSDLGFMLLGEAVAGVAGTELAAAIEQLVLRPAGMSSTSYGRPGATPVAASSRGDWIERRMIDSRVPYPVEGSSADFGGWREHVLVGEVNDGNAFHALDSCSGHAGLFSTARDLLRFGDYLLAGLRGERGAAFTNACQRFLPADPNTDQALGALDGPEHRPALEYRQALGFRRWDLPSTVAYGHPGFTGVAVAILPALQATVVLVTNRLHVSGEPCTTTAMWSRALQAAERHCLTTQERAT